jgi:hypothetical protein
MEDSQKLDITIKIICPGNLVPGICPPHLYCNEVVGHKAQDCLNARICLMLCGLNVFFNQKLTSQDQYYLSLMQRLVFFATGSSLMPFSVFSSLSC